MIGEHLHWQNAEQRHEGIECVRNLYGVLRNLADFLVAFAHNGYDASLATLNFLHVGDDLMIELMVRGEEDYRHLGIDEGDRTVLHFGCWVTFGMDIRDLLELECAFECSPEDQEIIATVDLLTDKPVIYAANMSDEQLAGDYENDPGYMAVKAFAQEEGSDVLPICASMEAEMAGMSREEKTEFLSELGFEKSGLDRLITLSYERLGLISYLTAGEPEVRAWTITRGTKAPGAAGKIHSDFERGFIRAEVVHYDQLMECGSFALAKEKGRVRSEGKEYVMKDGDVVLFRFNV